MDVRRENDALSERRRTGALAGLAAALLLIVLGLFLIQVLRANAKLEDCLMSGRMNCAPAAAPPS